MLRPFNRRNNNLSVYNPFKEMDNFEKHFFTDPFKFFDSFAMDSFKTDISDNGKEYVVECDLPGFKKEDIAIDINADTLTIRATRHSDFEEKDKKDQYIHCERSYGAFSRQFDISGIDESQIKAKYENGVLTLNLPKKPEIAGNSRRLEIE